MACYSNVKNKKISAEDINSWNDSIVKWIRGNCRDIRTKKKIIEKFHGKNDIFETFTDLMETYSDFELVEHFPVERWDNREQLINHCIDTMVDRIIPDDVELSDEENFSENESKIDNDEDGKQSKNEDEDEGDVDNDKDKNERYIEIDFYEEYIV